MSESTSHSHPQRGEDVMDAYPEHERQRAVSSQVETVRDFLEWLRRDGLVLSRHDQFRTTMDGPVDELFETAESPEDLIWRHFGIDPRKIESERRAMLSGLRSAGTEVTS